MLLKAKIENGEIKFINPDLARAEISKFEGREVGIDLKKYVKTRTALQNRSLHLWFTQLAEALNDAGYDMKKTLREELDIRWTDYNIKEFLWRPTQDAMFGKKSSRELTTEEIQKVYDLVDKTIAERTGIHIEWPSMESLMEMDDNIRY